MRGWNGFGIFSRGACQRTVVRRFESDRERYVERYRFLFFRNDVGCGRIGFLFSELRTVRPFLYRRRVRRNDPVERVLERHFAIGKRNLALFRNAEPVYVRLQCELFLGRNVLQGFLPDSRFRYLLRSDVRDFSDMNARPRTIVDGIRNGQFLNLARERHPSGKFFVLL